MTRTQLANKSLLATATFNVAGNGQVTPVSQQLLVAGDAVKIQKDPASNTQYTGYVCAWSGGCRCASIVSNLNGDPHMKIRDEQYSIAASPLEGDYTLYATASASGPGPIANATNGDLHIGH